MASFRKGALGSPFQTEYQGNQGMDMGPAGKPADRGPRIGAGVMGRRVTMEVDRDSGSASKAGRSGKRGANS